MNYIAANSWCAPRKSQLAPRTRTMNVKDARGVWRQQHVSWCILPSRCPMPALDEAEPAPAAPVAPPAEPSKGGNLFPALFWSAAAFIAWIFW